MTKEPFVLVGYSAPGKWDREMVYPIPELWEKASNLIHEKNVKKITGVCLPPRSDHYFYTCGIETDSVKYEEIEEGMTVHTFTEQKYLVFVHEGSTENVSNTYGKIWDIFDKENYRLKKGAPEIEVVESHMFGKELFEEYRMEIWIPVE